MKETANISITDKVQKLALVILMVFFSTSILAVEYTYDPLGRLTKASYDNDTAITYSYDDAGNLLSSTTEDGIEESPNTYTGERVNVYQTNGDSELKVNLLNDITGTPAIGLNESARIYSVTASGVEGLSISLDDVFDGKLSFIPPSGFSGVLVLNYQILQDGILYTVSRNIVIREFDGDGDGIPDEWEGKRDSIDGLDLSDASPGRKDLYLWIDHMYDPCPQAFLCFGETDLKLTNELNVIKEAFARQNIALHVKHGTTDNQVDFVDEIRYGESDVDCESSEGRISGTCGLANIKEQGFWTTLENGDLDRSREKIYHYMLIGNKFYHSSVGTNSTGFAVAEKNVIFVAKSNIDDSTALSGTILHELGHALGLGHGGPIKDIYGEDKVVIADDGSEKSNYNLHHKPNYLSVMNYLFQKSGIKKVDENGDISDGEIDFAHMELSTIDEADLPSSVDCITSIDSECGISEQNTLSNFGSTYYRKSTDDALDCFDEAYDTRFCIEEIRDFNLIDWARNADGTSPDVNWNGKNNGKGLIRLVAKPDWPHLDFTLGYKGDPDGAFELNAGVAASQGVIEPDVDSITFERPFRLQLRPVRQLSLFMPGESRPALGYLLDNTGTFQDSFDISYEVRANANTRSTLSNWSVSGPSQVTLASNTHTYLNISVGAPANALDGEEVEVLITVHSHGNSNNDVDVFGVIRITEEQIIDADNDGLPDDIELAIGSDPFVADTDGDGLNDNQDPEPNSPNEVQLPEPVASWIDITDQVSVNKSIGAFNRVLRKIFSITTITNPSAQNFDGLIRIELVDSNLALSMQSDGQLENGNHYWDLSDGSESFSQQQALSKQLNFELSRSRLNYQIKVHFKEL